MQIGEVIRKYRKKKDMTQEEMAVSLGVTTPAVNKWENRNSFPDIMLLAPIARLLDITIDELLSFRDKLTADEIGKIICKADSMLKEKTYEEAFKWAKKELEKYPNCESLIWQIAVMFDAQRIVQEIPNADDYDDYLYSLYERALKSEDETARKAAADSLFGFCMRKKQYDRAEKYLEYFSKENPERKRKQAELYSETGRVQEAYRVYEEILFTSYQTASAAIHGIYTLALRDNNMQKARMLTDKQKELATCFEIGKYHESASGFEIAVLEKDVEAVIEIMREMISSIEQIGGFCKSSLYEHMEFKEIDDDFIKDLKDNLINRFRDKDVYGFLENDKRWRDLVDCK